MPNSTPNSEKHNTTKKRCKKAAAKIKKVINVKDGLKPSADAIFFVRLFARACQPVC